MRITTANTSPLRASADVLVVTVTKPPTLEGVAAEIDAALGGTIADLIKAGEIRGGRGQVTVIHAGAGVRARRVAVAGLGADPEGDDIRHAGAAAARAATTARARTVAFAVETGPADRDLASRCLVEGAVLGDYRFDRFRSGPAKERPSRLDTVTLLNGKRRPSERAAVVATAVNRARDLQNAPSNHLGPEQLAERARSIAAEHKTVTATVNDRRFMERRKMGAFLAVAAAGGPQPALITLRHKPAKPAKGIVLGLVGKGLTFDTGGYSLKPARSMTGMKFDMSGAAAVLEATAAIAELHLPIEVVCVVGAVENLVAPNAMRNDDVVVERIDAAGELGGEHVWRMPLHDTYKRFMRSDVADMRNASTAGKGGACFAARFLQEFAGDGPWAHLDIAGVADIDADRGDGLAKGGSGWGVRLLVELAQSLC